MVILNAQHLGVEAPINTPCDGAGRTRCAYDDCSGHSKCCAHTACYTPTNSSLDDVFVEVHRNTRHQLVMFLTPSLLLWLTRVVQCDVALTIPTIQHVATAIAATRSTSVYGISMHLVTQPLTCLNNAGATIEAREASISTAWLTRFLAAACCIVE